MCGDCGVCYVGVCYVEHSQPTNVGTHTKEQKRSKETLNNMGKIDLFVCLYNLKCMNKPNRLKLYFRHSNYIFPVKMR